MRYPLEAVLGLRGREVLARTAAFGAAAGARSAAERTWEARRGEAEVRDARARAAPYGEALRASDGGLRTHWAGRLRAEAAAAAGHERSAALEVDRTGRELEARREELARAARARAALEEHRDRWRRARALERERREEDRRDELAVARAGR